ncbi:MAG: DUF4445 domain-containing protein [Clostridium sp.]|nr:DUF4445 domain-containing protein [Clostridium sp.]
MTTARVAFSTGQEVNVSVGSKLSEAIGLSGLSMDFPCGGLGKCGQCKVVVEEKGKNADEVLACTYQVTTDVKVEIQNALEATEHSILSAGVKVESDVDSGLTKCYLQGLKHTGQPLWNEVKNQAEGIGLLLFPDLPLLQDSADSLLDKKKGVTLVAFNQQVIQIERGDTTDACFGLAVDIGTTTVAGYLINLHTGEEIAVASDLNRQRVFGADVISRISAGTQSKDNLKRLQAGAIETVNHIIGSVTGKADISPNSIYFLTLAGNTTMHHLLLGLHPGTLGQVPFLPIIRRSVEVTANDLKLALNARARAWIFPVIAGFIGGDTVSAILACNLHRRSGINLLIDIGTNGELVINAHGRMVACSAAAGPALEGGQVTFGMRAERGAISKVSLSPEVKFEMIGQGPVKGLCGSGLIDLLGELIKAGLISLRGKLADSASFTGPDYLKKRLCQTAQGKSFLILSAEENSGQEIYLTQSDVSQLQLAKGALRAAAELLVKTVGVSGEDVEGVFLAGAFGNFMDTGQALNIGLLPEWAQGKVRIVGNAAGEGAKAALLSRAMRKEAEGISEKVEFLELAANPAFQNAFIEGMLFKQAF